MGVASMRAAHAHRIGHRFDQTVEHSVAGQAKDVVDTIGLAPRHHLGAAVMAVAANGQPRVWPMAAHTAQMAADFRPRRCRAGPQQHRHRARCRGVIDMDRQKAAFIVMGVEQRQLLMAVLDIDGVGDVERDRGRRAAVTGTVQVDHGMGHANDCAQVGRILPP